MDLASRLLQVKIYVGKCFRIFKNEKGWKTFITASIIAILISSVTSGDMFYKYTATRNGAFAIVCACIWIGIFNSIQSVCKERDIIKREHRSGLHVSSYVVAHLIYEMALSAVEAVLVTLITCVTNISNLPYTGVMLPMFLELWLTFFLIIYSSDALGLMISCIVKTPNTAMTVMPFLLIIQLVMSGMIFELEGFTEFISKLTIAKWGLNAICISANVNNMEGKIAKFVTDYIFTTERLCEMWLYLILFTLAYGIIGSIALKFVDKDKR